MIGRNEQQALPTSNTSGKTRGLALAVWRARSRAGVAGTALTLLMTSAGSAEMYRQDMAKAGKTEKQMTTTQSRFFCNIKALTPEERAHHKVLTEKLMKVRKDIVEMANGYDFQYGPGDVSLEELVDWVKAEAKCCPFFDFHIDVEHEGKLFCLRLTGEEGVKAFIRNEFQMQEK